MIWAITQQNLMPTSLGYELKTDPMPLPIPEQYKFV
jgi:hypothetical protein